VPLHHDRRAIQSPRAPTVSFSPAKVP
jgi:hypothetical protein